MPINSSANQMIWVRLENAHTHCGVLAACRNVSATMISGSAATVIQNAVVNSS